METVEIIDAGGQLAHLLERVGRGERITIVDQGTPVALLVPPEAIRMEDSAEVGRALLAFRDRARLRLGGLPRDLAHNGHRY